MLQPGKKNYFSKRALGLLSWTKRRQFQHSNEFLEVLADDIKREDPDLIVITGDIVQLGTELEIQLAKNWLLELFGDLPIMIVPGNHDNYSRDSFKFLLSIGLNFCMFSLNFRQFDNLKT